MDLTTRPASVDDAAAIAEAHVRGWQVAYRGLVADEFLDSLDVDRRAEQWAAILRGEVSVEGVARPTDVVVEADRAVVGFANIGAFRDEPDDRAAGELWAMYVLPSHWGCGAGHALMQETVAELRRMGAGRGYLWVLDGNQRARRFYERQGWRSDGVRQQIDVGGQDLTEVRYSRAIEPEHAR